METVHNKAQLQLEKTRTKTAKLENSSMYLKTFNSKIMKTIRYQLKLSKCFIIPNAYVGGHYDLSLFIILRLQKEQ